MDVITLQQAQKVAKLSRLRLTDDEARQLSKHLSSVLQYVSKLSELNTEGIEPMAHTLDVHNALRPDEPRPSLSVDDALANAPDKSPPFFKVPKVIGDGGGA